MNRLRGVSGQREMSAHPDRARCNERSCIHCEAGHRYPRWSRCNAGAPGVGTEGPLSIRACQALRPGAGGTFDVHSGDLEATLSPARRAVLPWVLASRYRDLPGRLGLEDEQPTGLLARHARCSSPARSGRPGADREECVSTILARKPERVDKGLPGAIGIAIRDLRA